MLPRPTGSTVAKLTKFDTSFSKFLRVFHAGFYLVMRTPLQPSNFYNDDHERDRNEMNNPRADVYAVVAVLSIKIQHH